MMPTLRRHWPEYLMGLEHPYDFSRCDCNFTASRFINSANVDPLLRRFVIECDGLDGDRHYLLTLGQTIGSAQSIIYLLPPGKG